MIQRISTVQPNRFSRPQSPQIKHATNFGRSVDTQIPSDVSLAITSQNVQPSTEIDSLRLLLSKIKDAARKPQTYAVGTENLSGCNIPTLRLKTTSEELTLHPGSKGMVLTLETAAETKLRNFYIAQNDSRPVKRLQRQILTAWHSIDNRVPKPEGFFRSFINRVRA